jgi:lipoate-protein ligase A
MWMDNWILNRPAELWPTLQNEAGEPCPILFRFFETRSVCVVLARSNNPASEVHLDACSADLVPVLRRRGGGGTVVLGPGCIVFSLAVFAHSLFQNDLYFRTINQLWADGIQKVCGISVDQRGISDLAVGDRKVAGTSLFRRKHLLVYQGSLLVDPSWEHISRYLQHPTREPDYRQGRAHRSFLTSLKEHGETRRAAQIAQKLQLATAHRIQSALGPHAVRAWPDSR